MPDRLFHTFIAKEQMPMLVKDRMTPDPLTVTEETSFEDALHLMKEKNLRRLMVTSKDGRLVGIVVEKDFSSASPSGATSLSVFEMHYLLDKLKIKDIMTKRIITVGDDCPLEEAARIMVDHRVASLPITKDGRLVGIITATDIFKTFVEILGGRTQGLRLTLDMSEGKGVLAVIANEIVRHSGNIVSLATFFCKDAGERIITVRVTDAAQAPLLEGLEAKSIHVLNALDMTNGGYIPQIIDAKTVPPVKA
jgi:acetoin utilization protein AcuB